MTEKRENGKNTKGEKVTGTVTEIAFAQYMMMAWCQPRITVELEDGRIALWWKSDEMGIPAIGSTVIGFAYPHDWYKFTLRRVRSLPSKGEMR